VQDWLPRLFEKEFVAKLSARDFIYASTPQLRDNCWESGYKEVYLLPPAVNPKVYSASEEKEREYFCDVAFVGNYTEKLPDDTIASWLKEKFFKGDLKIEGKSGEDCVAEYVKEACKDLNIDLPPEEVVRLGKTYFIYLIRILQRVQILLWAKELGVSVKVWGKFWENCPELAACAMGPVKNRSKELREIYQSSKVYLHIHPQFNFHFRVPEIIASGGFLMASAVPNDFEPGGLNDYLKIGEEIITFNSKEDFQEKLLLYLKNEKARKEIVERGRKRILSEHTYLHRAQKIIEDIKHRL
jgi:spore maturation protein CgeB